MQTIYLDISNKGVIPCINAKQGEVGRKFLAIITDNGVPYEIPDEYLLSVWYEGDTDAGNYSSIDGYSAFLVDGNKIEVELVAQMLLKPGKGHLCLCITREDGGETNTWNIPYEVEYKPGAGSSVPTEYYTALTEAASNAAKQVTLAKEQVDIASGYADDARQSAENLAEMSVDYIVEQGSDSIWQWRKWKSGIVELWGQATVTIPDSVTQSEALYYTDGISVAYPAGISISTSKFYNRIVTSATASVIGASIYQTNSDGITFRLHVKSQTVAGSNATVFMQVAGYLE